MAYSTTSVALVTTASDSHRCGVAARSRSEVSASAPRNSTVEMPAPTAASVSATSAASSRKKLAAISRLKMPSSITATNRFRVRTMATAVMTTKVSRNMLKIMVTRGPGGQRRGRPLA